MIRLPKRIKTVIILSTIIAKPTHNRFVFYLGLIVLLIIPVQSTKSEELPYLAALWNAAIQNNIEIKASETEAEAANLRRIFYTTLYAPTLILKGANSFAPEPAREKGILSDMSTASLVYSKPFSSGANLETSFGYNLTRPVTTDGVRAAQSSNLNISLSQGLQPWWIQGQKQDPQISLLENSLSHQENQLAIQKRNILISLTQNFIDLRRSERNITLLEDISSLHSDTLTSLKKLLEQGAVSISKIWDESQLLLDAENTLLQERNKQAILQEQIKTICGINPEYSDKLPLPGIEKTMDEILGLPPNNTFEFQNLETQISSILFNKSLRLQNNAPELFFSLDVSWTLKPVFYNNWKQGMIFASEDQKKPMYSISLGFDISPFFSKAGKREDLIEESSLVTINAKKKSVTESAKSQKDLFYTKLNGLVAQASQYRLAFQETVHLVSDAEILEKQGALTNLELCTYRNLLLQREVTLTDAEDQIWFLNWYIRWWL